MAKSFIPDEERIHCKRCGTCGVTLRTCPQCDYCVFCKKDGHTVMECPKVRPCPICNVKGHRDRKCPELSHGPSRLSRAKGWKKPHGSKSVLRYEQPKKNKTSAPQKAPQKGKRSGDNQTQVKRSQRLRCQPQNRAISVRTLFLFACERIYRYEEKKRIINTRRLD